ncbi:MAG: TRAP transporter large permease subunit [Alphaproteobacteria bacterium]
MHPALSAALQAAGWPGRHPMPPAWSRSTVWRGREPLQPLASLGNLLNVAGTLWICALMALIAADVFSRAVYDRPLPRVPEIVGYSIVAIVFLQLAGAIRRRRLTRADVVIAWLHEHRPVAGAFFEAVFNIAGAVVFALIAYAVYPDMVDAYTYEEYFGAHGELVVPVWPFRAIVVLCALVGMLEFFVLAAEDIGRIIRDEPDHPDARAGMARGWPAIILLTAAILAALVTLAVGPSDGFAVGVFLVIAMLVLILIGMPISTALIILSFAGIWVIREDLETAVNMLKIASAGAIQDQLFGVVPLFVLMGMLVNAAGIGRDTFDVCQWLLARIAGGLGVATVAANAIFAAITGVSIASAVVFTKVSVPPMLEHGYTARFSVGVVAGSSVLGMLIPPSLLLIVYGVLAEVSVGTLFTAAIVPGILLASAFALLVIGLAVFAPAFVGRQHIPDTSAAPAAWSRKPEHSETPLSAILKMAPITLLILAVLGGIYGGIFTPTEAGAIGALLALVILMAKAAFTPGLISPSLFWKLLIETGQVSVSILFLIVAANIYTRMIALSGLPADVVTAISAADLGFYGLLIAYLVVVLLMGMVLDSVSIMLITLPLVLPLMASYSADLIWFGIVAVITVEVGLLTPPLGLTVFVVKAALGNMQITLAEIFKGAFPFVVVMLLVIGLLIVFPGITAVIR